MSEASPTAAARTPLRPDFLSAVAALLLLLGLGLATLWDMLDGPDHWLDELTVAETPAPPVTPEALVAFPAAARHYLKHRWILKAELLRIDALLKLALFGMVPNADVMKGRDGFLFLEDDIAIASVLGVPTFTPGAVAAWDRYFGALRTETDRRGIRYLFVLAPEKASVYVDKAPDWLNGPRHRPRRAEVILDIGTRRLDPAPIDVGAVLRDHRARAPDEPLYFETDTHWNERGAAVAIRAALRTLDLDTPAPSIAEHRVMPGGDLARMAGLRLDWPQIVPLAPRGPGFRCTTPDGQPHALAVIDEPIVPVVSCTADAGLPHRVMVVSDSFGVAVQPYLAATFRETHFHRTERIDPALLDALRPDILIQVFAERKVMIFDPDAPKDLF